MKVPGTNLRLEVRKSHDYMTAPNGVEVMYWTERWDWFLMSKDTSSGVSQITIHAGDTVSTAPEAKRNALQEAVNWASDEVAQAQQRLANLKDALSGSQPIAPSSGRASPKKEAILAIGLDKPTGEIIAAAERRGITVTRSYIDVLRKDTVHSGS